MHRTRSRRPPWCDWRIGTAGPALQAEVRAFLGLGANVGDREGHLGHAVRRLQHALRVTGLSSVYHTAPVGNLRQRHFLNMVVRVETGRSARELLALTRTIEAERGRVRSVRNAPRTLDIDLLLHGDAIISEPDLEVPHPRMADRAFVLVPLLELEPELRDPRTGSPYRTYLEGAAGAVRRAFPASGLPDADGGADAGLH